MKFILVVMIKKLQASGDLGLVIMINLKLSWAWKKFYSLGGKVCLKAKSQMPIIVNSETRLIDIYES